MPTNNGQHLVTPAGRLTRRASSGGRTLPALAAVCLACLAACAGRTHNARRGMAPGGEPEPERLPRLVHFGKAWATAYALLLMVLTGCAGLKEQQSTLEQRQRESIAEKTTANVVRDSETMPSPTVIETEGRNGETTKITIPPVASTHTKADTSATVASLSSASGNAAMTDTFPFFVKLIGVAVGLALIAAVVFGIFWFLRRSSLAVKAATDKADALMANAIHSIRSEAINAPPGAETAKLVTIAADLERDRTNALKKT